MSGSSGTSGGSGTSGSSGTSGAAGASGSSGTSGAAGAGGSSGTSGSAGTSGTRGTSGSSGSSGSSGATGGAGASGSSGTSGVNGATGATGGTGATGATGASGTSGTSVSVSGTTNTIVKFASASTIGNSIITDNGSTVAVGGAFTATGTIGASNFSGTHSGASSGTNTGDQTLPTRASLGIATTDTVNFRDVYCSRGDGTGVVYLNSDGLHYLYWNGSAFSLSGGSLACSGNVTGANLSGTNTGDQTLPTRASLGLATTDNVTFGYVLGTYANFSSGNSENPTIGQVWTQSTGDSYLRKSTPAHFISQLGLVTTSAGNAVSATTAGSCSGNAAGTAGSTTKFMSTSHAGSYWMVNNWDGTYWECTTNHGNGVKVAYATNSGTSTACSGNAATATTATTATTAGNISAYTINQSVGTGNSPTFAGLTVGGSTSSVITMVDTDEGNRTIHCNSNRIGFLTQAGGWGAWSDDDGAWGVAGQMYAVGNVTAYYSDERLKTKLGNITNALEKVRSLNGFYFEANETAQALGYKKKREVGVSAQEVEKILPEIIAPAPVDAQYKTLDYSKLVPLLIEAIKEQQLQIDELKKRL